MSASRELEQTAAMALDGARARGVRDATVVVDRSRGVQVTYRGGRPDRVLESSRSSLVLRLFLDGRYSVCETNDLRPAALEGFLDRAVALTRAMSPDPYREITDPALYLDRPDSDLRLFDPAVVALDPGLCHRMAALAEAAALEAAGEAAISAEASFEDEHEESLRVHSNGFEGFEEATQVWLSAEVTLADDGDRRPEGWDVAGARFLSDLSSPESVGTGAAARAQMRLHARKGPTAVMPVIVENRAAGKLLSALAAAANARAIQQRSSFLDAAPGARVGSCLLHMTDDPLLPGGFGSRLFDREGISARRMALFDRGVQAAIYADTYYARKLGRAATTGERSNLALAAGEGSLEDLARPIAKGLVVRGFVGGNTNPTTGDFSLGVYGTLVENGAFTDAVSEVNISGCHKDLWNRLARVGADVWRLGTVLSASILLDGVQTSGS